METRIHQDGRLLTVEQVQDVEPILDLNAELRKQKQKSDWGRHVASIPNVILTRWLNEEYERGNINLRPFTPEFDNIVQRKLQDPEWKYLRTDDAQVQGFMGFGS